MDMTIDQLFSIFIEHGWQTGLAVYLIYSLEKHIWPGFKDWLKTLHQLSINIANLNAKLEELQKDQQKRYA